MIMSDVGLELLKAGLALVVAAVSLCIANTFGQRLSRRWDEARRQRELDLVALSSFYRLYGEFFAIWKEWSVARPRAGEHRIRPKEDVAWSLLQRACEVEGGFEAILVKLSLERTTLKEPQRQMMARFRQAYQSLREAIREGKPLGWRASPGLGTASEQYQAFKRLAADFAQLLAGGSSGSPVGPDAAGRALMQTTEVKLRHSWWVWD
jgi:hypothetical protein